MYDLSNFFHGDRSDILGISSNSAADLNVPVGQDLTGYFPPPVTLARRGLVSDTTASLTSQSLRQPRQVRYTRRG